MPVRCRFYLGQQNHSTPKLTRLTLQIRILLLTAVSFGLTLPLAAQTRFIHAYSDTSSAQLVI